MFKNTRLQENSTGRDILLNMVIAAISLFVNGFGVYLTIQANIGAVSITLLSLATFIGWLLGGPVGIGTLICAFATGPIMQAAFTSVKFDAKNVHHQHLFDSVKVFSTHKAA